MESATGAIAHAHLKDLITVTRNAQGVGESGSLSERRFCDIENARSPVECELDLLRNQFHALTNVMHSIQSELKQVESSIVVSKDQVKALVMDEVRNAYFNMTNDVKASLSCGGSPMEKEVSASNNISAETYANDLAVGDQEATYSLAESSWDAGVLCGRPELGCLGSMLVACLLIFTIMAQLTFCIVCYLHFTSSPFDQPSLLGLKDFRDKKSQSVEYADRVAGLNLAQFICGDVDDAFAQNALVFGTSQMNTLASINAYLADAADNTLFVKFFNGTLLCLVATSMWIISVLGEVRSLYHFCAAMASIPRGQRTVFKPSSEDPSMIVIETLRWPRLAISIFVALARFGCCVFLLYVGCMWLSYTPYASDLILNAAALEFVFGIDEMIFHACCPHITKLFISRVAPIRERGWIFFKGVDLPSFVLFLAIPLLSLLFYHIGIKSLVDDMREARDILCVGELQFFFAQDPELGMLWYGQVQDTQNADLLLDARLTAIDQINHGRPQDPAIGNDVEAQDVPYAGNINLYSVQNTVFPQLIDLANPFCENIFEGSFLIWARVKTNNDSLTDCEQLEHLCPSLDDSKFWVRFLCPETCGCLRPDSVVPSHLPKSGCPSSCSNNADYRTNLKSMSCTDKPIEELKHATFWKTWYAFVKTFFRADEQHKPAAMLTNGCSWLLDHFDQDEKANLCKGSDPEIPIRPFSPICPETCNCALGGDGCNPECQYNGSALP